MKSIIKSAVVILLLLSSCTKVEEQPYEVKFYGSAFEDIGYSVSIASDGYVIAGQVTNVKATGKNLSAADKDMGIIKTGWDGNAIWKLNVGGPRNDWGTKLLKNDDGTYVCVGTYTDSTTVVQTDMFIVKISATGEAVWQKHYGGPGNQTGRDLVKTPEGYLVLCTTDNSNMAADSTGNKAGDLDIQLMKVSDNGDLVSTSPQYGFNGDDVGVAIKQAIDGNYILFGSTERSEPGQNQGKGNLILMIVNSSGIALQTKIMGTPEDEYAADFEVLSDGYLLTYTIGNDGENQEVWVKKIKKDLYAAPFYTSEVKITNPGSTDNSAKVYSISKYGTDSYVLAGISGKTTTAKMMVCEIDGTGNLVTGHQLISGSTGTQFAYDATSGDDGYVIAVGKNSYDVSSMITFLKFKF
jgi:hypothetical protein